MNVIKSGDEALEKKVGPSPVVLDVIETTGHRGLESLTLEERKIFFSVLRENDLDINKVKWDSIEEMVEREISIKSDKGPVGLPELVFHKILNLSIFRGKNHIIPIVGHIDPVKKLPPDLTTIRFITTNCIDVKSITGEEGEELGLQRGPGDEVVAYGFKWKPIVAERPEAEYLDRSILGLIEPSEDPEVIGPNVPETVIFKKDLGPEKLKEYMNLLYGYFWAINHPGIGPNLLTIAKFGAVLPAMLGRTEMKVDWVDERAQPYVMSMLREKNEDTGAYKPLEESKDLVLEKIGNIFGQKFTKDRALTNNDLYIIGQLGLYYLATELGPDTPGIFTNIEQIKLWADIQKEIRKRTINDLYEEQIILGIIKRKLGVPRYKEFLALLKTKPYLTGQKITEVLKEAEKKLIVTERAQLTKKIEAAISNKCPHVGITNRLRTSVLMADLDKYYNQLAAFIGPEDKAALKSYLDEIWAIKPESGKTPKVKGAPKEEFECTNCHFSVICPHFAAMLLTRRGPFMLQRLAISPYVTEPIGDNYFCNVCGELISSTDIFGQITTDKMSETLANISDESYEMISMEIIPIVRLIQSSEMIPFSKIIKHIIVMIYPYLFELEKQIGRIQTEKSEQDGRYKLFMAIYALAGVIHLIISNNSNAAGKDNPIFLSMRGVDINKPGAGKNSEDTVALLKYGLARVVDMKNTIINKLHNITPEFMKNKLIEAYKILSTAGSVSVQESPRESDMFNMLITDPVFHYLYIVSGPGKKHKDMIEMIPQLLGQSLETISKNVKARTLQLRKKATTGKKTITHAVGMKPEETAGEDIYSKISVPKLTSAAQNFYKIKAFKLTSDKFTDIYNGPGGNNGVWAPIYSGLRESCAHAFFTWVVNRAWDTYLDDVNLGPEMPKIINAEEILIDYWKISRMKNLYSLRPTETRNYRPVNIKLGHIYDENGAPHKWTIYIMKAGNEGAKELSKPDILKIVESEKKQHNMKIIDKKCSVCGVLKSKSGDLNEKKINESLSRETNITNIVLFYENRCPVDDTIHDMDEARKCKKCGYFRDMNQGQKAQYYDKYEKKYIEAKKQTDTIVSSEDKPEVKEISGPALKYAKDWQFRQQIVLNLCNDLGLNANAFLGLGATERKPYAEITSGKDIEFEKENLSTRSYVIDTYITNMIIGYNGIKNVKRFLPGQEPQYILDLMNETRMARKALKDIGGTGPNAFSDYQEKLIAFRKLRAPRDIINFSIETLAQFSTEIVKNGGPIGKKYITTFLQGTLLKDELRAKPGSFNWNVFKAEDEAIQTEDYDPNLDNDAGLETKQAITEENLGTTDKPLQSNFDLDLEPDQDEEEFLEDNQLGLEE